MPTLTPSNDWFDTINLADRTFHTRAAFLDLRRRCSRRGAARGQLAAKKCANRPASALTPNPKTVVYGASVGEFALAVQSGNFAKWCRETSILPISCT
jgi:hypothetical protein